MPGRAGIAALPGGSVFGIASGDVSHFLVLNLGEAKTQRKDILPENLMSRVSNGLEGILIKPCCELAFPSPISLFFR
jgi:hypothetical protein